MFGNRYLLTFVITEVITAAIDLDSRSSMQYFAA